MSRLEYDKNNIFSYREVWERVSKNTNIENQNDLAKVVGVTQGAISLRKSKDIWPEEWAYRIGRKYNLLTEWILSGEGPKNLDEIKNKQDHIFPILEEANQWLSEIVVNEPFRRDWFTGIFLDAFPMFKQWKKRRDDEKSRNAKFPDKDIA